MKRTINCSILTPERMVYEGDVNFAVVPAYNGEMGFLFNHSPLIARLGIGEIRLIDEKSTEYLVVEGGIVEIQENKLIVLAENALRKSELDKEELEAKTKELESEVATPGSKESFMLNLEKQKMKVRLKVVSR